MPCSMKGSARQHHALFSRGVMHSVPSRCITSIITSGSVCHASCCLLLRPPEEHLLAKDKRLLRTVAALQRPVFLVQV